MTIPEHASKYEQLGGELLEAGDRTAARYFLEKALSLAPDRVSVLNRLAMIHAAEGDHRTAAEFYTRIVQLMPENPDARLLLGVELAECGNLRSAIEAFEWVVSQGKGTAGIHTMLGVALAEIGEHHRALESFDRAYALAPDNADILTRRAIEKIALLRFSDADRDLDRALSLDPDNALAWNNRGRSMKFQGVIDEAIASFRRALELEPDNPVTIDNYLLSLNYSDAISTQTLYDEHRRLSRLYDERPPFPVRAGRKPSSRIRIGYVSGDFHAHSVSFFLEPVLMNHDRRRFEIVCYATDRREDTVTDRLKGYADRWRSVAGLSDEEGAALIADDGIDILIDLSGRTAENRLGIFALKPAPLQASWLGYPHSTGLAAMDLYITDRICVPPGGERFFSEELLRLPRIFSVYLPPEEFPPVAPPPFERNGWITFGSFNNFAKVTVHILDAWCRILHDTPNSRLLLKSFPLGDPSPRNRVLERLVRRGIDPERVSLLGTINERIDHLSLYHQVDIALDTYPYNGTTTTCEALLMGVPVLTLAGERHASRVGYSILSAAGLSALVAHSLEEYCRLASTLASSPITLGWIRKTIRERIARSPLMDHVGFTRELESSLLRRLSSGGEKG